MGTDGNEETEKKADDGNEAMDVDNVEIGEKAQLGKEEEKADNSQKMEVDDERPQVIDDEDLEARRKEEGKDLVETKTGEGENHDVSLNVGVDGGGAEADGMLNNSLEEKGSDETPLVNESKNGGTEPPESQMDGSVLTEKSDEKLGELSNVGSRMENFAQHESHKDENPEKLDNDALGSKVPVQNGTKKEELSNELTSMNNSEEELKREVTIAKFEEPKKALSAIPLVVRDETKSEPASQVKEMLRKPKLDIATETDVRTPPPVKSFLGDPDVDGYESGYRLKSVLDKCRRNT